MVDEKINVAEDVKCLNKYKQVDWDISDEEESLHERVACKLVLEG